MDAGKFGDQLPLSMAAARKILIFGNSGSGKSTLARRLSSAYALAHLDLDTLAWKPTTPPEREDLAVSQQAISTFIASHRAWVIEGCYCDLLEMAQPFANEMIFMNLPVELCIENARRRPWEPHKYASKEAQDGNLNMLLGWIAQYTHRDDTFSLKAHTALYEHYTGNKRMVIGNEPFHAGC